MRCSQQRVRCNEEHRPAGPDLTPVLHNYVRPHHLTAPDLEAWTISIYNYARDSSLFIQQENTRHGPWNWNWNTMAGRKFEDCSAAQQKPTKRPTEFGPWSLQKVAPAVYRENRKKKWPWPKIRIVNIHKGRHMKLRQTNVKRASGRLPVVLHPRS